MCSLVADGSGPSADELAARATERTTRDPKAAPRALGDPPPPPPDASGLPPDVARLIAGPSEFDRIVSGDVLVTQSTTEAFNILLPLLGAIVTDSGGLLSHSAIVAREYGIPGVVGTRNATDLIADGTRVKVDGDTGEVTVYA